MLRQHQIRNFIILLVSAECLLPLELRSCDMSGLGEAEVKVLFVRICSRRLSESEDTVSYM